MVIDLNCDMGEGADTRGDVELLRVVTSANIACGGHAGSEASMRELAVLAAGAGVAVGAHPSYPDRANFGRVSVAMPPEELEESLRAQVGAMRRAALAAGRTLAHVKPHGALYHDVARDEGLARLMWRASRDASGDCPALVGPAGSVALEVWAGLGAEAVPEGFADRAYEADGSLRDRRRAGAVHHDPAVAAAQAVDLALGRGVGVEGGGRWLGVVGTLCVHSDTPGAAGLARAVRAALEGAGVRVESGGRARH